NGVIVNDEPVHYRMFQKVLAEQGIPLSQEEYAERYLAMDDRGCFQAVLHAQGRPVNAGVISRLIARKAQLYAETIQREFELFPGAAEFVKAAAQEYPLALATGALRQEAEYLLRQAGLEREFSVMVTAEDTTAGKPDPEVYRLALERLNAKRPTYRPPIPPAGCLVVEDSRHGVAGAHTAGMKCLAVTNSYSAEELAEADLVVPTLENLQIHRVASLFPSEGIPRPLPKKA
ncbi:MAG: HAD family phosphatase, partial [Elusimicrobia bacterium]|nr:HAD family phosphatase [Elusimicrobiota bacterium]